MATLQAIETRYKGYRFRSRLEARWAVFFDALDVAWEYEKEGFELPMPEPPEPDEVMLAKCGSYDAWLNSWLDTQVTTEPMRYLPDFWLPDLGCWVEIKGGQPSKEDEEKAHRLAVHSSYPVYLFWEGLEACGHGGYMHLPNGGWDEHQYWCECPLCHEVGIKFDGCSERLSCGCRQSTKAGVVSTRILDAFDVARAARFEFGEQG